MIYSDIRWCTMLILLIYAVLSFVCFGNQRSTSMSYLMMFDVYIFINSIFLWYNIIYYIYAVFYGNLNDMLFHFGARSWHWRAMRSPRACPAPRGPKTKDRARNGRNVGKIDGKTHGKMVGKHIKHGKFWEDRRIFEDRKRTIGHRKRLAMFSVKWFEPCP